MKTRTCENCAYFGTCPSDWYTTDQENYDEDTEHCDQWKEDHP